MPGTGAHPAPASSPVGDHVCGPGKSNTNYTTTKNYLAMIEPIRRLKGRM
jgi:hypothetical protein